MTNTMPPNPTAGTRRSNRAARSGWTRTGGFSLLELAVVLVVMGVLGVALWRVLPLGREVANADPAQDLALAEEALQGYALAHYHLPTADTNNDGDSDAGATLGWLPTRTLGLPSRIRLHYQVAPPLAAAPSERFEPMLPPVTTTTPVTPVAAPQLNGLDLCITIRDQQTTPSLTLGSGASSVGTAFALALPTEPNQAPATPPLPGSEAAIQRHVLALGPGGLASRLDCADRIVRTTAAARAAFAAYDIARFADEFVRVREFAYAVNESSILFAQADIALAAFNMVLATATGVLTAMEMALGWPPATGAVIAGATILVTAAQLGLAIYGVIAAAEALTEAEAGVADADKQRNEAKAYRDRMHALAGKSYSHADALNQAGLDP